MERILMRNLILFILAILSKNLFVDSADTGHARMEQKRIALA